MTGNEWRADDFMNGVLERALGTGQLLLWHDTSDDYTVFGGEATSASGRHAGVLVKSIVFDGN
jgi:hypothetical protein